jgi:hypothetical protein
MLFVAGRHVIGNEGNVDIGLSDEEGLHKVIRHALMNVPCRRGTLAPVIPIYSLKIFAKPPS